MNWKKVQRALVEFEGGFQVRVSCAPCTGKPRFLQQGFVTNRVGLGTGLFQIISPRLTIFIVSWASSAGSAGVVDQRDRWEATMLLSHGM